eukprot:6933079-Ditylum_brightwellii.AAC.1
MRRLPITQQPTRIAKGKAQLSMISQTRRLLLYPYIDIGIYLNLNAITKTMSLSLCNHHKKKALSQCNHQEEEEKKACSLPFY